MRTTIRPYASSDQKEVKKLILDTLKEYGFFYNPQYDSDLDDPSSYIKTGGIFYLLKDNDKVIGTVAIINRGKHIAELKRLYVDKNYQGQGYGSLLFDKAVAWCNENGFTKLEFETNKKFTKAHKFYLKKGCKIVSEDKRSYYMEKSLD